jgi:glycine betaine/proline transport system substrate-binding protein
MKPIISSAIVFVAAQVFSLSAHAAQECGSMTIADTNDPSSVFMASLDKYILNKGYGCDATEIAGDTVASITSLANKGDPNVISSAWVDLVPNVVKPAVANGSIVQGAKAFKDGGVEGWYVPKYVIDKHPDIKTIADALKHPELFPNPENPDHGAVYQGPQGWGATVVTGQLFKAYGAKEKGFDLVSTGSAAALDATISQANTRKKGWLGYYYAPTALLAKYPMVKLEFGAPENDAEWKRCIVVSDCPDPKPAAWPLDNVYTIMSKKFVAQAPADVMTYLKTRTLDNATLNKLLLWMSENQATGDVATEHFMKEHPEIWKKWVTPQAGTKIADSLK